MATITVQIEDTLQDNVDNCIDQLKDAIVEWVEKNPDADSICLSNDINYSGALDEIVDRNTPTYTSEIDDTFYLHSDKLLDAYESAGLYDKPPENFKQVCIYLYLEQACWEWFNYQFIELGDYRESESDDFRAFMKW